MDESFFTQCLQAIRARMDAACASVGRDPATVRLLPVSKTFGADSIRAVHALGWTRFGENKVQEIREKSEPLADCGIQWVMIGHAQTNKARDLARLVAEVQSLDRLDLAHALENRLQREGRAIDVLVQLKTSAEPSKYGLDPAQLPSFLRTVARDCSCLRVRGLMTMAENSDSEALVRQCFRTLRLACDHAREEAIDRIELDRLSMGMSGDFEIAIQEGSTEVRIGSAIFGHRS